MALPGGLPFLAGSRVPDGCVCARPHLRGRGAAVLSFGISAAAARRAPAPPVPPVPPRPAWPAGERGVVTALPGRTPRSYGQEPRQRQDLMRIPGAGGTGGYREATPSRPPGELLTAAGRARREKGVPAGSAMTRQRTGPGRPTARTRNRGCGRSRPHPPLAAATPADGDLSCREGDLAVAAAEPAASLAGEPAGENPCNATAPDRADRTDPEAGPPLPDLACPALTRVTAEGPESAGLSGPRTVHGARPGSRAGSKTPGRPERAAGLEHEPTRRTRRTIAGFIQDGSSG
jgi:hypothetical protein